MRKKIGNTILGIIFIYSSVAFGIKAGLGVNPMDASITTIAQVIGMKVGTFSMIFHGCSILGQILIERENFRKQELLQIFFIVFGGSVLNFFLYTVLKGVTFTWYPVRLLVCIFSVVLNAFGCLLVLETHLMRTPAEGFLQLLGEKRGISLGKMRQGLDTILLIVTIVLTIAYHMEWSIREGTIIATLIYGPVLDFLRRNVFERGK